MVSSSQLTDLDTWGDLIGYGTSQGGLGVLLEGRSVTLRPHNHQVTGVSIRGSSEGTGGGGVGLMSSSLDGTVRLYDLLDTGETIVSADMLYLVDVER